MSSLKVFIFRIGILSSLFCTMQMCLADTDNNSIDYSSVDVGVLQSQYQRQLNPKTPKRVVTKKPVKRRLIQNDELLLYQKLLAIPQTNNKQQTKSQPAIKPVRQAQKQFQPRVQRKVIPAPQPTKVPAPRRDAIFEATTTGDVRLIGQLISQGVNVNQANNERETALHMAAAKGHYSAVIYLLNHGANINARTINNWLPIHHATRFRHAQIANYLKQRGSPIHAKTSDGLSAIDMAKALNDQRILGIFGAR